ncbi:MAG: flavodoxin family protein [Eggerthellaceae bacterium]|nr:flavodoxin family protein [Eggerthellaceae bacterium]
MKVVGINGSPRKTKNTATMLEHALQAARDAGAEITRYDLVDLNYAGCVSCFGCKLLDGPSFGRCALRDELTPVLEDSLSADALVVATPIYWHDVTSLARAYFERLFFAGFLYTPDSAVSYERRVPTGLIYTMGQPQVEPHYQAIVDDNVSCFERIIGPVKTAFALECYQFDDYSKYASSRFDPAERKRHFEEVFPKECQSAYELGKWLVGQGA